MTVILTNDDGIDAPGLQALEDAVPGECIVVAPNGPWSGCGHQMTTHAPITVEKRSEKVFAIGGTPADCTRIALTHLQLEPSLLLAGINPGGNLGADLYRSGTVAAAREAAFLGVPAIAVSHYLKRDLDLDWPKATRWTRSILEDLLKRPAEPGTFWNVNLPHLEPGAPDPEMVFCEACTKPLPVTFQAKGNALHYAGVYAERPRTPGKDVDVCFSGSIAVSLIPL